MLVAFWFDGGLFELATAAVFLDTAGSAECGMWNVECGVKFPFRKANSELAN